MSVTTTDIRAELDALVGKMDRRGVPNHLRYGLAGYILWSRPVGGFLTAVLSNDLEGTILRADTDSMVGLRQLVLFLHGEAPATSWGSPEKVERWKGTAGQ